ncbi:hypothetical protein PoB_004650200 [Plakobranchus ocellatus]|uniref:Uncharacterized protein n=1 Tax=Plakobranchus ocellatus TaxID=259542 RepID=A0AAV4BM42_9GAST|nr:hypothetical protein PoB_004650200 [Plakobranchus ocellatus]
MNDLHCKHPFPVDWGSSPSDLTLALLYDFYILVSTFFDVLKIIICYVNHVLVFFFSLIGTIISHAVYYITWISVFFMRGILGLEDKSTSAFCWLLAIFFFICYCDHQHLNVFTSLPRGIVLQQQPGLLHRLHNLSFFRQTNSRQMALHHEQRTVGARMNLPNRPINQQLEAENVLNENEANFLVEADHRRVLYDNRHNVALENGAAIQQAQIENRQNVERECHNVQTSLDNQRNCTQERHRYFLRQRRSLSSQNNAQNLHFRWDTNTPYAERYAQNREQYLATTGSQNDLLPESQPGIHSRGERSMPN